jgi:hypothetical protein
MPTVSNVGVFFGARPVGSSPGGAMKPGNDLGGHRDSCGTIGGTVDVDSQFHLLA